MNKGATIAVFAKTDVVYNCFIVDDIERLKGNLLTDRKNYVRIERENDMQGRIFERFVVLTGCWFGYAGLQDLDQITGLHKYRTGKNPEYYNY